MLSYGLHVILVAKFGGTPGKLLMGIRVRRQFEDKIDFRSASIRYAVDLVMLIVTTSFILSGLFAMTEEAFQAIPAGGKNIYLANAYSSTVFSLIFGLWVWSEFIVMLFNKQRRAIHDYFAGTIVVYDQALPRKFILPPKAWIPLILVIGLASEYQVYRLVQPAAEALVKSKAAETNILGLPENPKPPAEGKPEK